MTSSVADVKPMRPARAASGKPWSFTFSANQITPDEQSRFDADLAQMGLDANVWAVYNSVLQTRTEHSRPLVLRAYNDAALIGMAIIYECRKTGDAFFEPPLSRVMDLPGLPMFVWLRYGVTIDHCANPGFVTEGVDRQEFIDRVTAHLLQKYMLGSVVEYAASPSLDRAAKFPFADVGLIDTATMAGIGEYTARGKNLSRKLKKFQNKGGELRTIEGPMPGDLSDAAMDAFTSLRIVFPTPFQDNYSSMTRASMSLNSPAMLHIVALLDGEYAGHQSFCRSGAQLLCQSGWFDRRRKSTYHAYENIIVRSVEYALEHDLDLIDYGPVFNETKAKMMTRFIRSENRAYARYRPISAALPLLIGRSKVAPSKLEPWRNLGERAGLTPK